MKINKKLKKAAGLIHLWLGLFTGIVVVIIGITGCLYVFEQEIRDYLEKDYAFVPVVQQPQASLAHLLKEFEKIAPGQKITGIEINNTAPNATISLTTGKHQVYYLNPYNGSLVKKTKLDFLVTVQDIHTSLLLGDTGKFIIRWSVVIFVLMLISGLILWFPGQIRLIKQAVTIKWGASFKRVNYDLHNVLGFYASGILLVSALSGLYFGFKEVKTAVSFLSGSKLAEGIKASPVQPVISETIPERYERIYRHAIVQYPGAKLTNLSIRKDGKLRLRLNYPSDWARKRNTFFYDIKNGRLISSKLYQDFNRADWIEAGNYDLHTGRIFGLFGKVAATIVSLIAASLPITGFIIWLKRGKKKKKIKKQGT
ncbi:PepSY-associated TM helix domain-containing protein [Pedobacter cryoconitis]|uniref:Putative iron-regulated membrane protein n=1 Tax=Pedobacter cryoconitis TaxID=188932 RepID=A0A327SX79_9SPHI|nr:PepSY-associated TM helix domain-containing protein [Pedobacter cryoconitis]RAJ33012.1 putative iron-regulated membrane protein [Pedobacter cryoconitis]